MDQNQMMTPERLNAGVSFARSLWREARLITAGASNDLVAQESRLISERRKIIEAKELDREEIAGALYSVVLLDATDKLCSPNSPHNYSEHVNACAITLKERHGFDVQFILDAVIKCAV